MTTQQKPVEEEWVLSPQGFRVCWIKRDGNGEITASGVVADTANNKATRTPENAARARLIAAAPAMLEALETIEKFCPCFIKTGKYSHISGCTVEAAINLARGVTR